MLVMRLQRTGRRNEPTFRLVLTDKKNGPKSGRFIDILGSYDPRVDLNKETFDLEKISHWLSKGVQPSETVHNLLINLGVIKGEKINVLPQKAPVKKEKEETESKEAPEGGDEETPSSEEATEEAPKEETPEEAKEEMSEEKTEETPTEDDKTDSEAESVPEETKEETPAKEEASTEEEPADTEGETDKSEEEKEK